MADYVNSTNMSLPVPVVGTAPGPTWATLLNTCLTTLDSHSHVAGSGVPITPAAMDINADLSMGSNDLTSVRTVRFSSQSAALALAADIGCLYEVGDDLYYNDGSGNQIRITQSGSVTGSTGTITGLPSGTASATYVAISSRFTFQSTSLLAADIDAGALIMRNLSPNSTYALTLQPPAALSSNYSITLPALPASTGFLQITSSGVMSANTTVTASFCPPGIIIAFGGNSVPTGWLACDGSAVNRITYSSLFTAIGVAYGQGNGATTFNVPDLRGRFLRGVDGGTGRDPNAATRTAMNTGGNTGDNVGSIQSDAYASHTHPPLSNSTFSNGFLVVGAAGATYPIPAAQNATTGASGGSETRPINAYVKYIIKT